MRGFGIILQFLTGFYLPFDFKSTAQDITRGLVYFAAVGALIGALLFGATYILSFTALGWTLQALIIVALWVFMTGGLHLDGVADSADGLFSGRGRERMLEIMKDSHIGTFGVVALVGTLAFKWAVVLEILSRGDWRGLILAPIVGRGLVVFASTVFKYAREEGMGNFFIGKVSPIDLWINGVVMIGALVVFGGLRGLWIGILTLSVMWLLTRGIHKKLSGITGDILGLIIEGSELVFLLFWVC